MTTLRNLYDIIKPLTKWADNVYLKRLPQSDVEPGQTFILLTERSISLDDYGSNVFNSAEIGLQLQIFYALDFNQDYEDLEFKLMKQLTLMGYTIMTVRGHTTDPDTHQDFQTILITKRRLT